MRSNRVVLLVAAMGLASCNQQQAANSTDAMALKSPGRYAGIGSFDAGPMWKQIAGAPSVKDPAAAKLADDEHIIVVLDSHTGEVRQCGDHSGVCVAMNPWSAGGAPLAAPVRLAKHAADLDAEAGKAQANTTVDNGASEPSRAPVRR